MGRFKEFSAAGRVQTAVGQFRAWLSRLDDKITISAADGDNHWVIAGMARSKRSEPLRG